MKVKTAKFFLKRCLDCGAYHRSAKHTSYCPACGSRNRTEIVIAHD